MREASAARGRPGASIFSSFTIINLYGLIYLCPLRPHGRASSGAAVGVHVNMQMHSKPPCAPSVGPCAGR